MLPSPSTNTLLHIALYIHHTALSKSMTSLLCYVHSLRRIWNTYSIHRPFWPRIELSLIVSSPRFHPIPPNLYPLPSTPYTLPPTFYPLQSTFCPVSSTLYSNLFPVPSLSYKNSSSDISYHFVSHQTIPHHIKLQHMMHSAIIKNLRRENGIKA